VIGEWGNGEQDCILSCSLFSVVYGFKTLKLNNIMLSVHADNCAGISCYKKVGFKDAGRRREWVFKDGKYIDKVYMDILAREFYQGICE